MIIKSIRTTFFLASLTLILSGCSSSSLQIDSPDGEIHVSLENLEGQISYKVQYKGEEIIGQSKLGLNFRNLNPMNEGLKILGSEKRSHDSQWERIWGKNKTVRDHYNELVVHLADEPDEQLMDIILRVYDDGVAIRYHLPEQNKIKEFELTTDETEYVFKANHRVWAVHYGSFHSHQESEFYEMQLDDPRMKDITGMPLLVELGERTWVAITEANLTDWAGMYVKSSSDRDFALETVLAPYPDDNELLVRSEAPRYSPWRLIMIGESPGDFIESDIIANLNEPNALEDVSWIQPGKSAWDWWWCNYYSPDVDFKLGPNTATMKHFIDLAAEMGWEYQLVDWLWYGPAFVGDTYDPHPTSDITTMEPEIDIPELVRYGAEKGVKILLWLEWNHADRQMDEAFPLYEKWGVAGVKVDFMARDDQYVVNFYHRLVKKAAEHHLVVDFHGAYKPTGVSRTLPNLMTREGILGNEYTKWSDRITPEHKVTIPFTRGMVGPMDFTPGAFVNVTVDEFKVQTESPTPMAMGTRCNELAMLVVYESPLAVLCDAPYNYRNSPAGTDFLKIVPTTWDETKVLNASVGDYITTARRSGDEWYIGTMTDLTGRTLSIPLDFLEEGDYTANIWKDSEDAGVNPVNLVKETVKVSPSTVIEAIMAPGGGHVIHIKPEGSV
ncbi:glycoside hydrolase family 97 protein [Bacteroidota bacterium]